MPSRSTRASHTNSLQRAKDDQHREPVATGNAIEMTCKTSCDGQKVCGEQGNAAPGSPCDSGMAATATCNPPASGDCAVREALFNGGDRGPAFSIARPVDEIAAINGFMVDVDLKLLDPDVLGESSVASPAAFYDRHLCHWLDRDAVLAKAEARDTGGGVHVLLWLDEPVVIPAGQQRQWNAVARGLHSALPGDPKLGGIIAMTRPVGELNLKYDPPHAVRLLREGTPVTQKEVLGLVERLATAPARLWMNLVTGGERASPCPLCRKEGTSLGIAGDWKVQCYECGRVDAARLVYLHYTADFLGNMKEPRHG